MKSVHEKPNSHVVQGRNPVLVDTAVLPCVPNCSTHNGREISTLF